jgi:hypothetical protein
MTIDIKNATKIESPWVHVFLYGWSGAGKTTAAASFPKPLFLVPKTENSVLTLRGRDFDYIEIESTDQMIETLEYFYVMQQQKGPAALPFETLVFESLSHYCDMLTSEVFQRRSKTKGGPPALATVDKLTTGAMQTADWGVLRGHFLALQRMMKRFEAHVVYTALADAPSSDGFKPGNPLIQGAAKDLLPSACDVISYLSVDAGEYSGYNRERAHYYARTRFQAMPTVMKLTPATPYYAYLEAALDAPPGTVAK